MAGTIDIEKTGEGRWRVTVRGQSTTVHEITLSDDYCRKLTGGKASAELLLEKSFDFLLARESNTSILSRFDLAVIGRYFPEYEKAIIQQL